jgi:hypothetical protein
MVRGCRACELCPFSTLIARSDGRPQPRLVAQQPDPERKCGSAERIYAVDFGFRIQRSKSSRRHRTQ